MSKHVKLSSLTKSSLFKLEIMGVLQKWSFKDLTNQQVLKTILLTPKSMQ